MHMKISVSQRTFWIILTGGLVFGIGILSFFEKKNDPVVVQTEENIHSALDQEDVTASPLPMRLRITKIGVDAAIDPLGVTSSGEMAVPNGPSTVGWFSEGPRPGDIGTAVIDGHYGRFKNGEGSVFDNLSTLEIGDTISVENAAGTINTFVVREWRTYDPSADTSDIFSSDDEQSHLNLITCEGVWDKDSKSYAKRLVVFTDKE